MRLNVAVSGFGQLDLWRIAGKGPYEDGEQYVDAVADLQPTTDGVRATVHDTEPYQVSLGWADGSLTGDCSCPHGREGMFCKHCVAVGLSWIDGDFDSDFDDGDSDFDSDFDDGDFDDEPGATLSTDDLRAYVASLDHGNLVNLLCEHAADDGALHQRLSMLATRNHVVPDV
jgi:uncharacterized Zn finger protein